MEVVCMDLFEKVSKQKFGGMTVDEAKAIGIYPYFSALSSKQDTEVELNGRSTIMLGSNNYLGLTSHPDVIKVLMDATEKYGSGCSGSRFLNGTMTPHLDIEEKLAKFLNKPAVVTFSTGFGSNLAIISSICGTSMIYATMVRYEHSNMKDLEEKLKNVPSTAGILIVTDGVFSMGGDICDLPNIVKLAKKYGARVMVDDAHALGILGKNCRGTAEHFGLEKEVDIYMGTFSKSLASLGGYMAGEKDVVSFVQHTARPFIFTASMTPASAGVALKALEIMENEPKRRDNLVAISKYAAESFKKAGIPIMENKFPTPIVPIITGDIVRTFKLCVELMNNGVYVNPVIPPAVAPGQCIIRTSYTATHTKEQIDRATAIIKSVFDAIPNEVVAMVAKSDVCKIGQKDCLLCDFFADIPKSVYEKNLKDVESKEIRNILDDPEERHTVEEKNFMQLTTHSKNYQISEKLTGIISKKLDKVEKYFDEGTTCTVICNSIGKTEKMEITIGQKGRIFRAEVASGNMFVNIDLALAKIEKQIIKNKEKLRSILKKESLDDKKFAFYTKAPKVLQAEIMKQKTFAIEPLTVEEAELALDTTDHTFYVYANKKNNKVNIMYRRTDGHIGIIEISNSKITEK
ncbi:class ii aminotransferase/8-amino-7-oxononanoate synthase [Holotrichia oblita]|nr:class ii aminotransferase/8-amino-7-oxononanoate synthase [Holotrichia oblita]